MPISAGHLWVLRCLAEGHFSAVSATFLFVGFFTLENFLLSPSPRSPAQPGLRTGSARGALASKRCHRGETSPKWLDVCYGGGRIRRRRPSQLSSVYGSTAPANSPTTRFMHCSSRFRSRASCFSSRAAMPCRCSDYPKFLRRGSPTERSRAPSRKFTKCSPTYWYPCVLACGGSTCASLGVPRSHPRANAAVVQR